MAPLGISLLNLLIESSSSSSSSAGNSSFFSASHNNNNNAEGSTASFLVVKNGGNGGEGNGFTFSSQSTASFEQNQFNNNNNYFSGKTSGSFSGASRNNNEKEESSPSFTSPKLYSQFWEKFKKSCDSLAPTNLSNLSGSGSPAAFREGGDDTNGRKGKSTKHVHFKEEPETKVYFEESVASFSPISSEFHFEETSAPDKKFYEREEPPLKIPLSSLSSLLSTYPSDLHYYGRLALMTVVTGFVIEKTLEGLPDVEQLLLQMTKTSLFTKWKLLDGSDPNQPGKVGLDKDFF